MEDQNNKEKDYLNSTISIFKRNKIKVYSFIIIILILSLSAFIIKDINKKKNNLIAEKYLKAEILLKNNKKEEALIFYENIINSESKFYAVLSLNNIIEKNLVANEDKILNYFSILENLNYSQDQKALIILKKALFFLKNSKIKEANNLLEVLANGDSNLKFIAKELISK